MRIRIFMTASVFFAFAFACGGGAANVETATVVVPPQPPQPIATASTSQSVEADGGATDAAADKPFTCHGGQPFEIGARSYCAYSDAQPWEAAEARCVENGGHLATIESRATNEALKKALGSPAGLPRAAWIGLEMKKSGTKKEWRWSSGRDVKTAKWSKGEPNDFYGDGSEACGEWLVSDGRWNDTRCDLRLPVLCELPPKSECENRVEDSSGHVLCLDSSLRRFPEAKKACMMRGGRLAELDGDANEKVTQAFAARFAAKEFWIGLTDVAEEGTWTWVSGARVDFRAWGRGEPNDYLDEDCVEVHADTWMWNDSDCGNAKASLCEAAPKKK